MDCTEAKNYLSAYIDGETDPSLSARYAQHLTACSECRHACEELLQLRATLKSTARVHTLPVQLRMQLQRELAPKKPESSVSKSGFRTWLNAGLLSACSAALAMTLTLALTLPG